MNIFKKKTVPQPIVLESLTIKVGAVSYTAVGKTLNECRDIIFECMKKIKTAPIDYIE